MFFKGSRVTLRSVAISDVGTILMWENDPELAQFSDAHDPYTEEQIIDFIVEQQRGLEACGQLRLMIDTADGQTIGAVDIFDYDGASAELGVLVYSKNHRCCGYATEAITAVIELCAQWGITTLWATIDSSNSASTKLFTRCGFKLFENNRYKYETNSISVNTLG